MCSPLIFLSRALKDGEGDGGGEGGGDGNGGGDGDDGRNRPGDVGKDREHSGRAHQTNSRTHTHSRYTPLFVRSLLVRSLARAGRARARADTTDVRRRRGKKKHRGSANRADTRHCALARYRLAPVLHGRTRGSLLERLVAKLRGRAPSLSRGSCPSERARTTHPLSLPSPFFRQPPVPQFAPSTLLPVLHPPLFPAYLSASAALLPLSLPLTLLSSLLSRTFHLFSLFLSSYHPRPREKRYVGRILSPRGSRATCVLVNSYAPWQRDSLLSTGETDDVNGARLPTNVQRPVFVIAVAICSMHLDFCIPHARVSRAYERR